MNLKRLQELAHRGPAWAPIAPLAVFALVVVAVAAAMLVGSRESGDGADEPVVEFVTSEVDRGAETTGGTLVVAVPGAPATLNLATRAGNSRLVRQLMMPVTGENLLSLSPDFTYLPQLAESVPNAADGTLTTNPLTVRFTLREGVSWSDGAPLTGEDVRFTWQTMSNPQNRAAGQAGWMAIADVRTPSAREVEIEFARPYPEWRSLFSASGDGGVLLPKHLLDGIPFDRHWADRPPVGTGPFAVGEHRPGVGLVLIRNVNYWDKQADGPHLDRIVHSFMVDGDAAEQQFAAGNADIVELRDFSRFDALAATPGSTVLTGPSATIEMLTFNTADPVLRDLRVRQALIQAVSRTSLTENLPAAPAVAQSVVPAQLGAAYLPAFEDLGVDLDATERLLGEAGYSRAESTYYRDANGEDLQLEILAHEANPARRAYLDELARQLDEIGVAITLRLVKDVRTPLARGRFQIAATAVEIDPEPQIIGMFASRFIPRRDNEFSGLNYSRVSDRRFDRLRAKLATETNQSVRTELLRDVQRTAAEVVAVLPLFQWPTVLAVGPTASGVALNPSAATSFSATAGWYSLTPDADPQPTTTSSTQTELPVPDEPDTGGSTESPPADTTPELGTVG